MTDLEKYYNSEIYEPGMPNFETLENWQRQQLQASTNFARWKAGQSLEAFKDAFLKALHIPDLISWLSNFIR